MTTYIQNMYYTVMKKCFIINLWFWPYINFVIYNLSVSPLHCNHQYHADFDICHDLHGLIIREHVPHIPEEIFSYIVSHQTRTTIRFCLNKKASVCLRRELNSADVPSAFSLLALALIASTVSRTVFSSAIFQAGVQSFMPCAQTGDVYKRQIIEDLMNKDWSKVNETLK